jgi:Lamin Tail Domain
MKVNTSISSSNPILIVLILALTLFITACEEGDSGVDPVENYSIVINEVMARNADTIADEDGQYDDWVELYNASASDIDIGGFTVTDNLDDPVKWTISINNPEISTIPAGGYLLLWADNDQGQGANHLGFSLSGEGEEFGLYDLNGNLVDAISFGPQNEDVSYGRLPDANDHWVFLVPSPAAVNSVQAPNMPPAIQDTQRSPSVPLANESVDITAVVTDEFGVGAVQLHYRIDGGEFAPVEMTDEGENLYRATIPAQPATSEVQYYVTAIDTDDETSSDPRFAPTSNYSYTVLEVPDVGPLYINEIMAANSEVIPDEYGDFDDWIEIYNSGDEAVDIGGMYITDDLEEPTFYQIPLGHSIETTVPAGGFILLWADKELDEGPLHVNIKLSADGESVGLYESDEKANTLLDAFNFPSLDSNEAFGRTEDGGAVLQTLETPTPGSSNNP